MERLATAVDERWQKRLTDGDPLKKGAQLEEVGAATAEGAAGWRQQQACGGSQGSSPAG
jgi:hypothetical protein